MCGIVAYVGLRECVPALIDGLRRLEDRGYELASIAVHTGTSLSVVQRDDTIEQLARAARERRLMGKVGVAQIGFTYGAAAAPRPMGPIAVAHTGIVENFDALRRELAARGSGAPLGTDADVIAELVSVERRNGAPRLAEAVRRALLRVEGPYAVAVIACDEPSSVVVAKQDASLFVGYGDGAVRAASELAAVGEVSEIATLMNGEVATLADAAVEVMAPDGSIVERPRLVGALDARRSVSRIDLDEASGPASARLRLSLVAPASDAPAYDDESPSDLDGPLSVAA